MKAIKRRGPRKKGLKRKKMDRDPQGIFVGDRRWLPEQKLFYAQLIRNWRDAKARTDSKSRQAAREWFISEVYEPTSYLWVADILKLTSKIRQMFLIEFASCIACSPCQTDFIAPARKEQCNG